MILSFAQFEREITAERIRDKIAASKAKGIWMGGTPPPGYRGDGRSLAIVEEYAHDHPRAGDAHPGAQIETRYAGSYLRA